MKLNNFPVVLLIILLISGCGGGGAIGGGGTGQATLTSISVSPVNPSIAKGATKQFKATGTYSDGSTQDLTSSVIWTSSNSAVATIDSAGLATSVDTGSTTITARSGLSSDATTLTVKTLSLNSISISPANRVLSSGMTDQFTAMGTYSDSSTQDLTSSASWNSSATAVATISNSAGSNGLATSVGPGTTTITADYGGFTGRAALTVPGSGALNVMPISVNGSLCSSGSYPNKPCVSVTVCSPGTSTCQTINDILLDTGATGLRLFSNVLTISLPQVTVASGNLADCIVYEDGSADWGPVKTADVVLGGEPAVRVPIHVIDATFGNATVCGIPEASPAIAGFNGTLGLSLFREDCGPECVTGAGNGMYYACTGANCTGTTVDLASQVQNPVAHLPLDNNGVLIQLPSVPLGGKLFLDGQLVLGIDTRANNSAPAVVTGYPADTVGDIVTILNGSSYSSSFIDSGSNGLFLPAFSAQLPICSSYLSAWFCPATTKSLTAITEGYTGSPAMTVPFQIGRASTLLSSSNNVFAEIGGPLSGAFDWGLPFFFGRTVFLGIEPFTGKNTTGLGTGRFWAY